MDVLLVLACGYFAFSIFKNLFAVPISQWQGVHYAMLAVGLALLVLGSIKGHWLYKKNQAQKTVSPPKQDQETDDEE